MHFKVLNISIDESTLHEFVHVDDKNSEKFSHEILDDVNEVLESIQATIDNEDENIFTVVESYHIVQHQQEMIPLFAGLNTYTIKFLKLKISCYSYLTSIGTIFLP